MSDICTNQIMGDLLEEWCLSIGHPNDLDVTGLSVALEQAGLKYHAQAVRSENFKTINCKSDLSSGKSCHFFTAKTCVNVALHKRGPWKKLDIW